MKSLLALCFSLCLTGVAVAQDAAKVKWYSLEEALKLNQQTPKKFLIDIYTDWCGWCKKMDAGTFSNPDIAAYLNKHFYPVKFNAESPTDVQFSGQTFKGAQGRQPHQFAQALFNGSSMGYPAIAYLTDDLKLITLQPGYKTPQDLEPMLHYVVEDKFKQNVYYSDFEKNFVSELK